MFYKTPPTYYAIKKKMIELNLHYPFLGLFSIGKSTLKEDILAFRIGNMESPTLYVGAFHALEWLTTLVLMKFCEDACSSYHSNTPVFDINLKTAFKSKGLIIIPCFNIDGVNLVNSSIEDSLLKKKYIKIIENSCAGKDYHNCWQANIRGVDLNHNYNAGYKEIKIIEKSQGISSPGPTKYGGKKYESEKETKSLIKLCNRFSFNKAVAFHSQGEEIYYEYGENTPPNSSDIANIISNITGYSISHPPKTSAHGGFKDWFIENHKKCGFTLEIGSGKNPLPISDFNDIFKKLEKALYLLPLI